MEAEEQYRRLVVGTIVRKEMACQDDHWNDDYGTRPDTPWRGRLHEADDLVEFCGRPYEVDLEAWITAYIEAEDEVIELRQSGHARARGILDLPNEMAFTCDDCGLWSYVGHKHPKDNFSHEERGGSLFAARSCDPDAVRRTFGKPFDQASVWDRERTTQYGTYVVREESPIKRNYDKENAKRRAKYAAMKEAKREESTSEY